MTAGPPANDANYLAAWREFRGMTQEQLAEAAGTTAPMISHLETGRRQLTAKWLRKLGPALRTSPGFLLDHHPDDISSDVMEIWNSIPEGSRDQALKMLNALSLAS
jgi:transcriptional regulator with XRE-family HTH domain